MTIGWCKVLSVKVDCSRWLLTLIMQDNLLTSRHSGSCGGWLRVSRGHIMRTYLGQRNYTTPSVQRRGVSCGGAFVLCQLCACQPSLSVKVTLSLDNLHSTNQCCSVLCEALILLNREVQAF